MKKNFVLLLSIVVIACSTTSKDKVELFNGLSLKLNAGESLQHTNPYIHETYFSLFDNENFSIPLFKWIKGDGYSIFVGILYNTSIEQFINSEILKQPFIELKTDSVTYGFVKSMSDEQYLARYVSKKGGNNLFIAAITHSSRISDSLFTHEKIESRLNTK